jgi:hypothetical protein
MYVTLSWIARNGTPASTIQADFDHAMPATEFTNVLDAFEGLRLANVTGENLQFVNDLGQTLLTLSDGNFDFVLSFSARGNFMTASDQATQSACDTITRS